MSVIEVQQISKCYGEVVAVDCLSFSVDSGEILSILGPNGAGKTTTLEILEGYQRPDYGEVSVLGYDPTSKARELFNSVGIVSQESVFEPFLSVKETLLRRARWFENRADIDELLYKVGLGDKVHSKVKKLSGGQRRRLDLALSLVGNPKVLFLDEPTTGFDPVARREAWNLIIGLKQSGMSIILTTHYMEEAEQLADRVLVINSGKLVTQGSSREVISGVLNSRFVKMVLSDIAAIKPSDLHRLLATHSWIKSFAIDGDLLSLETEFPLRAINEIIELLRNSGVLSDLLDDQFKHFEVLEPRLEDVILSLN